MRRSSCAMSAPSWAETSSKVMNSSCWPSGALVVGVKIGSGSRDPSTRPVGQGYAGDGARSLVLLESGAGEIAARDALDLHHVQAPAPDGPPGPLGRHVGGGDDVVGDDVAEPVEPPQRQLGEDPALVGYGRGQHNVVHGDPVRRDENQVLAVGVDVTDLAGVHQCHRPRIGRVGTHTYHTPSRIRAMARRLRAITLIHTNMDTQPRARD